MLTVFDSLKNLVRLRATVIDNAVFQLHYRWTVVILIAFSLLVNLKQYWGEAIQCSSTHNRPKMVDKFCWVETTFTVPSGYEEEIGKEVAYPGVKNSKKDTTDRKYHAYYQWVGLTLCLQAVLFRIPHYIWKSEEGDAMKNLVSGLNSVTYNKDSNEQEKRLITYLKASSRTHATYVVKYLLCETANFVNVVCQFVLLEKFLGGEFSSYSLELLQLKKDPHGIFYALFPGYRVFPRMTKCTYYQYGSSGNMDTYDALCQLPLNVIHEKIFVFLFVWFFILSFVSAIVIIVRFLAFFYPEYREMALASHATICHKSTIRKLCQQCSFFEWFFLKLVVKNVSSRHAKNILEAIAKEPPANDTMFLTRSKGFVEETIF